VKIQQEIIMALLRSSTLFINYLSEQLFPDWLNRAYI